MVHEGLLDQSKSVVFTSATLGAKGSRGVEWELGYLYLEPDKRFKAPYFLSPAYDYENNTKIFLCDDVPSLYDTSFVGTVLSPITKLVRELGGRSLLLFSAKTRFETAREILIEQFEGEIPVFIQGMGSHVVEDFKNSDQGILIGMEAFGEGIDIPGDSLMFVFIDKIPDLRMDLVIQNRRDFYEKSFGNEFSDYYLSHRARGLHQKLGRLLRTENDRGGVIIVDSRIKRWKGRTMEKFIGLMTPYKIEKRGIEHACAEVLDFVHLSDSTK
jgi:ATP-dependent DNA helicase DinG